MPERTEEGKNVRPIKLGATSVVDLRCSSLRIQCVELSKSKKFGEVAWIKSVEIAHESPSSYLDHCVVLAVYSRVAVDHCDRVAVAVVGRAVILSSLLHLKSVVEGIFFRWFKNFRKQNSQYFRYKKLRTEIRNLWLSTGWSIWAQVIKSVTVNFLF